MTVPAPVLRPAQGSDPARLATIERAAATLFPPQRIPDPADVHDRAEFLEYLRGDLLEVPVAGPAVVAFLAARRLEASLHVDEPDVDPAWAGHRIGARLLDRAGAEGARLGLSAVTLTTFEDLPWNGPYYRRLGFRCLPEHRQRAALRASLASESAAGVGRRVAMMRPTGCGA